MIEKKVAYEELNLLPIWLNKKSQKKTSHTSYNIGLYFFKELNISIIVPELDNLTTDAKKLFKNIHVYMNSISVNSKYLRNIEEGEIDVIFKKNSIIHIFLIGRKSSMRLHDSDVTIKLLPSLSEMLSNPDKKKKLWHDIQSSLNGEMKGNN